MAPLPKISGQLGTDRAAHLLRRATFGPTKADIESFASMDIDTALNTLLTVLTAPTPPVDPKTGSSWLPKPDPDANSDDRDLFTFFKGWFLEQMRTTGNNLREKMVYFLHTHLPADHSLIMNATSLYYQNELYRQYAFGDYKELFAKVTVDNAMLYYIDNTLNDMAEPNENFAREMFELYTIGKGDQIGPEDYTNYTEDDIKAASKVLTGIKHNFDFDTLDNDGYNGANTGLPRGKVTLSGNQASRHDPGTKTFSSKFNDTVIQPNPAMMESGFATEEGFFDELNQMMDMIFDQDETARFICRKLYRFFVYYKITDEIEQNVIVPLAENFKTANYSLASVVRELLSSTHFFDEDNAVTTDDHIGAIIKSPIDLVIGIFRTFKIGMPTDAENLYNVAYRYITEALDNQGMKFYIPIDVAGYPAYHQTAAYNRNWISPNWLARRYQFGGLVINGVENQSDQLVYKLDTVAFVDDATNISTPSNPRSLLTELTDLMFPRTIPSERFEYFLNTIFLDGHSEAHWTDEWNAYKGGGDDTTVRSLLDNLIKRLIESPEYQLF